MSVTLDVPATQDAAGRLDRLSTTVEQRLARVRQAAARAHEDVPSLAGAPDWAHDLRTRAIDLSARVDLALAVSGSAGTPAAPVTYEVPSDTGAATRALLGEALGLQLLTVSGAREQDPADLAVLARWQARAARWVEDPDVAPALVAALGDRLLEALARVGRVGFSFEGGTSTLPVAALLRRSVLAAARAWGSDEAHEAGLGLEEAARAGAARGTGLALAHLLHGPGVPAALLTGLADGADRAERVRGLAHDPTAARGAALGNELVEGFGPDEAATDPTALVLLALAASPRTALAWWSEEPARTPYWTGERAWPQDGGTGLLRNLAAATSHPAVVQAPVEDGEQVLLWEQAALLVSAALPPLAAGPALGEPAAEALAQVLARWLTAVQAASSWTAPRDEDDPPLPPGTTTPDLVVHGLPLPPLPRLDVEDLAPALRLALAHESGRVLLRSAADSTSSWALALAADLVAAARTGDDRLLARQHLQTSVLELAALEGLLLSALPPASTWTCVLTPPSRTVRAQPGPGGFLALHERPEPTREDTAGGVEVDDLPRAWSFALATALADRGLVAAPGAWDQWRAEDLLAELVGGPELWELARVLLRPDA